MLVRCVSAAALAALYIGGTVAFAANPAPRSCCAPSGGTAACCVVKAACCPAPVVKGMVSAPKAKSCCTPNAACCQPGAPCCEATARVKTAAR